jgi:hypothetical protein
MIAMVATHAVLLSRMAAHPDSIANITAIATDRLIVESSITLKGTS